MDVTAVLAAYIVDASADELSGLVESVAAHVTLVTEAAASRDFVDVGLARRLAEVLQTLVADAAQYTARERALLAGAIRYFTEHNDVSSDLTSPTGFEDDAAILNAVCVSLGRVELTVEPD